MQYKNKIDDKIWHHPAVNLNGQAALGEFYKGLGARNGLALLDSTKQKGVVRIYYLMDSSSIHPN